MVHQAAASTDSSAVIFALGFDADGPLDSLYAYKGRPRPAEPPKAPPPTPKDGPKPTEGAPKPPEPPKGAK